VDFGSLLTCLELSEEDIANAAASHETFAALLARFEQIAAPDEGASIILAALARLATTAECDWCPGELRIEIQGDAKSTKISVSTSIGGGFREKLFRDTVLRVPFEELSRGVALGPKLIAPLVVKEHGNRIVLTATNELRRTSLPPPMITVDPSCLVTVPRLTMPYTVPATRGLDGPEEKKIVLRRKPRP
jgi:hypothetical protein